MQGMKMAGLLLKQMAILNDRGGQPDFSSTDAQEALSTNPVLLMIAMMVNKRGLDSTGLQSLLSESSNAGVFDDETLKQLTEVIEKLAETDPALQQLVINFKQLTQKKMTNPFEFSYEILQMFSSAFEMGPADVDPLRLLMGDGR
jgi:hypothetical protein